MSLANVLLPRLTFALVAEAPAGADHFRRGDRLAAEKKYAEALAEWKEGYLGKLPSYRSLPFLFPVEASIFPRAELKNRLVEEIRKEHPDSKLVADAAAFSRFGFFLKDFDLRGTLLDLLTPRMKTRGSLSRP